MRDDAGAPGPGSLARGSLTRGPLTQGPLTQGPLTQWYEVAGVRAGTRRIFQDDTRAGKVFFPAQLVPYLTHEAVRVLPLEQLSGLAVRHLYQFLLSATHLETRMVNRAAEQIATNQVGLDLPMSARLDAFKVYCDEGYHALYSLDLADQIATATGIAVPDWNYGGLVDGLAATGRTLLPDEPRLAQLLQVVVFETLITAVLNELPHDQSVVTTVREVMRDHAKDEGRHHRFFAGFFHELWTQLGSSLRPRVAHLMPVLIRGCLDWDTNPVRSSLQLAGLDPHVAHEVVQDCYGDTDIKRIQDICQATVRMCESAGVLDIPGAEEEFATHGLLPPSDPGCSGSQR